MNSLHRAFWSKLKSERRGGCCLYTGPGSGDGYGSVCYRGKQDYAHRFSWILRRGPIPDGLFVLHKCDVRRCVNLKHLFLGTQKDNIADAMAKKRTKSYFSGGWCKGTLASSCKLNEANIKEIRRRAGTQSSRSLGREFKVDKTTIAAIVDRKTWKHVL
jgi:hypothetical protein